jgi:hypothetical protein
MYDFKLSWKAGTISNGLAWLFPKSFNKHSGSILMRMSTLRAAAAAAALAVTAGAADAAAIFSLSPSPIPDGSALDFVGTFDTPYGYVRNIYVTNYELESLSIGGGGTTETFSGEPSVTFYSAATGGSVTGTASFSTTDLTLFIGGGFNPFTNYLGTFPEQWLSATWTGTQSPSGDELVVEFNPAIESPGSVTIGATTGGYLITNSFTMNGQFSINGGPPAIVPPLDASLQPIGFTPPVPEPSTWAMLLLGFAGLGYATWRSQRRTSAAAA